MWASNMCMRGRAARSDPLTTSASMAARILTHQMSVPGACPVKAPTVYAMPVFGWTVYEFMEPYLSSLTLWDDMQQPVMCSIDQAGGG